MDGGVQQRTFPYIFKAKHYPHFYVHRVAAKKKCNMAVPETFMFFGYIPRFGNLVPTLC
jgi:hypothetical protein